MTALHGLQLANNAHHMQLNCLLLLAAVVVVFTQAAAAALEDFFITGQKLPKPLMALQSL